MISLQWDTSGAAFKRHCGITGNDHGARGTAMRHGAGMWARAQIASCDWLDANLNSANFDQAEGAPR